MPSVKCTPALSMFRVSLPEHSSAVPVAQPGVIDWLLVIRLEFCLKSGAVIMWSAHSGLRSINGLVNLIESAVIF